MILQFGSNFGALLFDHSVLVGWSWSYTRGCLAPWK